MRFRLVPFLAFAILFSTLSGCGSGQQKPRTRIRLIHTIVDGGAVDVWLEGNRTKLYENVAYKDVTLAKTLAPGTYNFQIRPAFASSSTDPVAESGPVVIDDDGGAFTLIAAGLVGVDAADPDAARVLAIDHEFGPTGEMTALARFVHVAPGVPTLDVTVDDNDPEPDDDSDQIVSDLERYTASDPVGTPVDADDPEQVQCFDADLDEFLTSFTSPRLMDQGRYLVLFLGGLTVSPREHGAFEMLVVGDDGSVVCVKQNPRIYLMNTVADAPLIDAQYRMIDVFGLPIGLPMPLEDNLVFGDLGGDLSVSLVIEPGNYEFAFTIPEDNPFPTVQGLLGAGETGALLAGQQYLFCVSGRADQTWPFELIRAQELFDLDQVEPETQDLWRIVHSAPDLTSVVLGRIVANVFEPMPEFPLAISPGNTTAPAGTNVGVLDFVLAIVRQNLIDQFGLWEIVAEPAARQFVVLLGSLDGTPTPGTFERVRLTYVDTTSQPWSLFEHFPIGDPANDPPPDPE